ncbi:glycosyltransferase family 4 protein [Collinsella ihumii]|uniref:Glycosyltransferase family 4 protein n=1 Tax=Collinsella ihumii TaxID=1720204 RepID=A0AAW7JPR3_9ACTN|nr:glycosyltransferase family 4 protein [Collinsella ihumii]MDN0069539.1 glycosyltransferase family 4 protein [Collinsella ihumii]
MKVLFISLVALEDTREQNIYGDLLKVFRRHEHEILAVSPRERRTALPTEYDAAGDYPVLRVAIGNVTKNGPIEKGISLLRLSRQIEAAIDEFAPCFQPDLIIFATPPTTIYGLVARLKKKYKADTYLLLKDIFPQNSVDLGLMSKDGIKGILYKYFKRTERKTYQVADYIGCMSPANRDYLLEHERWLDDSRVEVNPNSLIPLEPHSISISAVREEFGLPVEQNLLVYGGNLGKPQAIDVLIEALKINEVDFAAHFVICGSGTERSKLESFFSEKQPSHATLLPNLSRIKFNELLGAANAGLILLDSRFTIPNYPSRLLSYLQAGLPVLVASDTVSDMGPIAEQNGFGIWCSSDNSQNLIATAATLFNSDYQSMGINGRRFFEQEYSAERSYRIIERHFDE